MGDGSYALEIHDLFPSCNLSDGELNSKGSNSVSGSLDWLQEQVQLKSNKSKIRKRNLGKEVRKYEHTA